MEWLVKSDKMATAESVNCRICSSCVSSKHSIALFSRKDKSLDIADRLSRVIGMPVVQNDGHSWYLCRPCNRKFLSAEALIKLAKASYEKSIPSLPTPRTPPTVSTSISYRAGDGPRKRTKDTSGDGISPHTQRARPTAKRQTVGSSGRRLAFPVQNDSKEHNQ